MLSYSDTFTAFPKNQDLSRVLSQPATKSLLKTPIAPANIVWSYRNSSDSNNKDPIDTATKNTQLQQKPQPRGN